MTPDLIIALIASTVIGIGCFALGWEVGVHRHREQLTTLRTRYVRLREQIDQLTEEVSSDPIQFGIKTGRDYVIGRLASLMAEINEESTP